MSFGDSKSARELAAMETLRRLHPGYERDVAQFLQVDPAQAYRHVLDVSRLVHSRLPKVLAVVHDRAGGTRRHVGELQGLLAHRAHFLCLSPLPGRCVALELLGEFEGLRLEFSLESDFEALVELLLRVGVGLVHYHHLLGHDAVVKTLAARLGVPFDFTVHDHYSYCPQISLTDDRNRYCGELGEQQCGGCLQRSPPRAAWIYLPGAWTTGLFGAQPFFACSQHGCDEADGAVYARCRCEVCAAHGYQALCRVARASGVGQGFGCTAEGDGDWCAECDQGCRCGGSCGR